jgi:hypothetical protein
LLDRVEIVPVAVSSNVGSTRFQADGACGSNAIAVNDRASCSRSIDIETTTIDAFCALHSLRPDVVKIDVEGAELDALTGARRVLAMAGVHAFVEFHPTVWAARGVTPAAIHAELTAQRLIPEPLDPALDIWSTEGISVRLRHT